MAARERRRDWRISLGIGLTIGWLACGALYITFGVGWGRALALSPSEAGEFLDGAVAPLAFLWLVLGLFLQQSELSENNRAIRLQYEAMQRTAEQAEIQSRAIQANELHARQDTFIELAQLVLRQLAVIAGFLFVSSQGAPQGGTVSDEEIGDLWGQLGSGDTQVFARRLMAIGFRLPDAEAFPVFYGTAVRTRHCDTFVAAFERLLRAAEGCDPEHMIRDALLGDAPGRLYRLMVGYRANPPPGCAVVPAG
jgi:hypothetical protein